MDPFVRTLVQRLADPAQPLSRNRHFHTFDNAEGRYALRLAKRLRALYRDILASRREGAEVRFRELDAEGNCEIEVRLAVLRSTRVSQLNRAEFELLHEMPGMREALRRAA